MKKQRFVPCLSFADKSEEAMQFYASHLPGAKIAALVRYGKNHPLATAEMENLVLHGTLSFMDQEIMFLDMGNNNPVPSLNWSMSFFIECKDEAEFDNIFKSFSEGGTVLMGPEPVAHFRKCTWVTDKFGVTWQAVWE